MATLGRSVLFEGITVPCDDPASTDGRRFVTASRSEAHTKLLTFIGTTETYETDRLFGLLRLKVARISLEGLSTSSNLSLPPPATLPQLAPQLISRHSRWLEATETLKLLPPLVQARDDVAIRLMVLDAPRSIPVRLPSAPYLIGRCTNVLKLPGSLCLRGEVTYYQCRDAFSRFLKEIAR